MLERLFRLSENQTGVRTEMLAGVTTFLTMASNLQQRSSLDRLRLDRHF